MGLKRGELAVVACRRHFCTVLFPLNLGKITFLGLNFRKRQNNCYIMKLQHFLYQIIINLKKKILKCGKYDPTYFFAFF